MGDAVDHRRPPSPRELKAVIDAERTGQPFLVWRDRDDEQRLFILTPEHTRLMVGRRETSDVPLTWDPEVSRTHAMLEPVGQDWTLVDDGMSRNGSFVNGSRISGRQRLHDRDRMCFGNTPVIFRGASDERGSESTARGAQSPNDILLTERKRRVLIALCRPVVESGTSTPATNPQIADEVCATVDTVKGVLRELFDQFGLGALPQNEKRSKLVSIVLESGVLKRHDF